MKKNMLDYIKETPEVVLKNLEMSEKLTSNLVDKYISGEYKAIWIIASGSSYNSSMMARDFMKKKLKTEVRVIAPSTFTNYESETLSDIFVVVISQTGYSTNAIEALKKIKKQNKYAIGITGDLNSEFKNYADLLVDYGVGIETVGYVTKGVTTLVVFLMLFALESSYKLNYISLQEINEFKELIKIIMQGQQKTVEDSISFIDSNIKSFSDMGVLYIVGFGANYGTACEAALKVGELVHLPSIPIEMEEYIHGPNLQLTPGYTIIILDNGDTTQSRVLEIFEATKAVTDKAFLLTPSEYLEGKKVFKTINPKNQLFNPLVALPFFQVLAYYISCKLKISQHPLLKDFKNIVAAKTEEYTKKQMNS